MKILVDMNLSPRWCRTLGAAGYEAIHWSAVGDAKASDAELFTWARDHEYIVLTCDLDFGDILAATKAQAPSVLQLRVRDLLPDGLEDALLSALSRFETELTMGALIIVDHARARVRILPLNSS